MINVLTQTDIWDGVQCDGSCLQEDIKAVLEEHGIDPEIDEIELSE